MIFDHLERFGDYSGLHPGFKQVQAFLNGPALARLAPGRHELAGGVFAMLSEYPTKPLAAGFIEFHRRYIDVQVVLAGRELVGVCHRSDCAETAFDHEKDLGVLTGTVDFITLKPGSFAVFGPQDGHMPQISPGENAVMIRKVVFKVPVSPGAEPL